MLNLKETQKKDKEIFGSEYIDNGYVCVWQDGHSLLPEYVSHKFKEIIQKNNMPYITFHWLRHTCATLLLSKGYDIKLIQEYLGHSSVVTTGNIYAHVQFSSKVEMGASLASIISKVWLLCDYFLSLLTNNFTKEKCRYFGKPEISASRNGARDRDRTGTSLRDTGF